MSAKELLQNSGRLYSLLSDEDSNWLHGLLLDTFTDVQEQDVTLGEKRRQFRMRVYPILQNGVLTRRIVVLADQTEALAYQQRLSDARAQRQCGQKQFPFPHVT